jgi:hypothetical protein
MKIKACLSIGYADARQEEVLEIADEDLDGMTESQKDDYLRVYVQEWADNYIENWYEIIEEDRHG